MGFTIGLELGKALVLGFSFTVSLRWTPRAHQPPDVGRTSISTHKLTPSHLQTIYSHQSPKLTQALDIWMKLDTMESSSRSFVTENILTLDGRTCLDAAKRRQSGTLASVDSEQKLHLCKMFSLFGFVNRFWHTLHSTLPSLLTNSSSGNTFIKE